jgi:hypothetical protein
MFHWKVAHSDSLERRQRVAGGSQPLPDWLRGEGTVMAEPQHTQPEPAISVLGTAPVVPATASVSLSQPMGELPQSYSYRVVLDKGTCPLCRGNEDVKHILLSCPETKKMENAIYE